VYKGKVVVNSLNYDQLSFNILLTSNENTTIIQIHKPFYGNLLQIKYDNSSNLMKYISNTENSAVWSTESGYGFVRTSSADHPLIAEKRAELPQYDKSLTMVQYGKGEPSVPGYYSVRGEVEKAYAAIINGDDIISTLNQLNEDANAILADATAE